MLILIIKKVKKRNELITVNEEKNKTQQKEVGEKQLKIQKQK